jgi:asparagine synthase (glutamine-hydrolysing)
MLGADLGLGLVGDMLVKVDRMSMASSLEVRCPYLDHRVVECAAAMPGHFKLAPGAGKRILRQAFADRLPAEVFARPKKGFEIPVAEWLRGELADLARRATDPGLLKRQGLIRPELPRRWMGELASGRRDRARQLWALVAFQAWWERRQAA